MTEEEEDEVYIFEPKVKFRLEQIITNLQENPNPSLKDMKRAVIAALICVSVLVDYFIERKKKPKEGDLGEQYKEEVEEMEKDEDFDKGIYI